MYILLNFFCKEVLFFFSTFSSLFKCSFALYILSCRGLQRGSGDRISLQSLLVASAGICLPLLDGGDVLVVEEHLEPLLRVVVTQLFEGGPCWPKVSIFYEENQGCGSELIYCVSASGSGSSIFPNCGSGSSSEFRVLMTKKGKQFTALKNRIFF
jgi:hypothetical protein